MEFKTDNARRPPNQGRGLNLCRTTSIISGLRAPRSNRRGFIYCNVVLGEPNSKHVNNLYPVVDGFPAFLHGSEIDEKATVSQRLRAPAALSAILRFGDDGSGDRAKSSGFHSYPAFSPSGFSHSQVNRGVWLTGCCGWTPCETPNPNMPVRAGRSGKSGSASRKCASRSRRTRNLLFQSPSRGGHLCGRSINHTPI